MRIGPNPDPPKAEKQTGIYNCEVYTSPYLEISVKTFFISVFGNQALAIDIPPTAISKMVRLFPVPLNRKVGV